MDSFIIHLGKIKFHIEPISNERNAKAIGLFKIYEVENVFLLNEENIDNFPPNHLIGTLTIHDTENPKNFDFNGSGKISGNDLLQITEQIIQHFDIEC